MKKAAHTHTHIYKKWHRAESEMLSSDVAKIFENERKCERKNKIEG